MDERQAYLENEKIFEKGIASGIARSPYRLGPEELDRMEQNLHEYSKSFGEDAVLVSWGQPFTTLEPDRKYHPLSDIQRLRRLYERFNHRGICPKAERSFDMKWVAEQRERLKRQPSQSPEDIDLEAHVASMQGTQF